MTLNDAFESFLYQKQLSGLADDSVNNYRRTLSLFLASVGSDLPLSDVSLQLVEKYVLSLLNRPLSRATVSSYVRNIRIFLRWAYLEHDLPFDPAKLKVPKSPKKIVHIYSNSEIMLIFKLAQTSEHWITARNHAIIALMLDSGLRQCEICSLRMVDVDRERFLMKVTGKGSKDRFVPLGRAALAFLDVYLEYCPFPLNDTVFLNRRGNRLSGNAVRLFVYRLQKQLPFKLSSHKLRHNFATNFCIDQMNEKGQTCVYDLSILMGHESIETTKKYEHFAHEIIAASNSISHLDNVYNLR